MYTKTQDVLKEFCEKFYVALLIDMSGKTIAYTKSNMIIFTDGTFTVLTTERGDDNFDIWSVSELQGAVFYMQDPLWNALMEFIESKYPEYAMRLYKAIEEDNKTEKDNYHVFSIKYTKMKLKEWQDEFPELNIKFSDVGSNQ